jgi:hypothetical protein
MEGSTRFTEDLKAVPEDVRDARREAERKLDKTVQENPAVDRALDLRIVLLAAAGAFLVALVARLVGVGFMPALILFVVLFAGAWFVLAKASAARRPTRPTGPGMG